MYNKENFEELKELRSKLGWSQQKLANFLETSLRNIQNWEGSVSKLPHGYKKLILKELKKELKKDIK